MTEAIRGALNSVLWRTSIRIEAEGDLCQRIDSKLSGVQLYAPTLLAYELTSIARKKAIQYPGQRDGLAQTLEAALAMEIRWTEVMHSAVLRLALETGLTTYDATYLDVARSLGLPLVTFDQRLQTASRDQI